MNGRRKITPEETAELQILYSELPAAIAEAAKRESATATGTPDGSSDGDEKIDTIIRRIVQLTDDSDSD
jgi:hypothetical protein